jgi:hypothetical protein
MGIEPTREVLPGLEIRRFGGVASSKNFRAPMVTDN